MEIITLKSTINHKNKFTIIPILAAIFGLLYTVSGAISYQSGGFLSMPQFEKDIPFMPWTIWIYMVLYPVYLTWALFSFKSETIMNKNLYSFTVLAVTSCLTFIIVPISYPRGMFPLSLDNDLTTLLFRAVRASDKPSNCLPSLHVGLCYLFAWGYFTECKKRFVLSFMISTLIAVSTLTTKQHYIYDIVAGFALATVIYYFFARFTQISFSKS